MRKYDNDDEDDFTHYDDDYPPKNKYRGRRRDLMKKTKDKARNLIKTFNWGPNSVKLAEHLQFCNKPCCHNPRAGNSSAHDKTLQERKADEDENDI